jgi:hypothetical protein
MDPTDTRADDSRWRNAHEAARALHDALARLGVPETELNALTARPDIAGTPRVHVPGLTPASVHLILTGLAPYLGPEFIGRRDAAPIAPVAGS